MQLDQTLTKESFFNEMMKLYPLAMKMFCYWIDEYKQEVQWDVLFNNDRRPPGGDPVKFHHLPYAMQYGIWIEFCRQKLDSFFEQPEHVSDRVDLEEDIKGVFSELEPIIREYPED